MKLLESLSFLLMLLACRTLAFISPSFVHHRQRGIALFLEPLAKEGSWAAYLDEENTGLVYYFNGKTGESRWEPPTDTFPPVTVDAKEPEKVTGSDSSSSSGGFFPNFLKSTQEPTTEEITAEEVPEKSAPEKKVTKKSAPEKKVTKESNVEFSFSGMMSKFQAVAEGTATGDAKVEVNPTSITLDASAYVIPHPEKVRWGGEDAVYCDGRNFGVFDGVSGAEKLPGIPLYSYTLSEQMAYMVDKEKAMTPREMLDYLTEAAEFADVASTGASTAIVASIAEDGTLCALNVGDSVLVVIRDNKVVAKSKEIVYFFECPYQLSEEADRPKDGTRLKTTVKPGDVVVMGSDGVFDNLRQDKICEIVSSMASSKAKLIAKKICDESRRVSLDEYADTPYALEAKKANYEGYEDGVGGKVDDISCIVVRCS